MLDPLQLSVLKTIRNRERSHGVSLYLLTGAGIKTDDAYGIQQSLTKTLLRTFSGAVAWGATFRHRDVEGGFESTADVTIAVDAVEKTHLERQDTHVDVDGIRLRVTRLVDLPETGEVLIYGDKF